MCSRIYLHAKNVIGFFFWRLHIHLLVSLRHKGAPPTPEYRPCNPNHHAQQTHWMIQESERHALDNGWSTDRHDNYPTVDIEINDETQTLKSFVYRRVFERILPEIESKYHLTRGVLGINEIFIVKYDMNGQRFLEPHQDGSEFSFVAV